MSLPSLLLLILGALSLAYAANARWPRRNASLWVMIGSWFLAFLVVELAVHIIVVGAVVVGVLAGVFGALDDGSAGWIGLALWLAAAGLVLPLGVSSLRTRIDIDGRSEELELDDAPGLPWYWYAVPVLMWFKPGVRKERGRVFAEIDGEQLKLDIVRPKHDPGHPLPAVVHVHGGMWMFGSRHEQGIPLLNHLASNGWVGFNIDYRLSPKATMPDHVEDVKRAVAWVREHAEELNVDPNFIAITGGSAGGHLTALTALSNGDPAFQRGFEGADASVQAAVPFYGAYDFVDHEGKHSETLVRTVERVVVKQTMDEAPEFYATISPTHRINADAPPFFVVHGSRDTIVPVGESRRFVKNLRVTSHEAVLYAEMPGGQHAFDSMPTWRSGPVIKAIERFLNATYATRYLGGEATEDVAEQALTN